MKLSANGGSGEREIRAVGVESDQYISVSPTVAFNNPDGCTSTAVAFIVAGAQGYREKMSVALTAQATRPKVDMWFVGCTNSPFGGTVPVIWNITVVRD